MNYKPRTKPGLSLMEMVVIIAAIALLVGLGVPAVRALTKSFETGSSTKSVISAALSNARAIAAKNQRYAGIRFQKDLNDNQYMVFIVHDFARTGLSPGFRAVEGLKPIKLPDNVGVMDLMVRTNHGVDPTDAADPSDETIKLDYLDDTNPANLIDYGYEQIDGKNKYIMDTTSFSIVFSPSGKMVMHDVRVRNKDGNYRPVNLIESVDDTFNSPENIINNNTGMLIQDDYAELGLGAEPSRNSFVIYDKNQFNKLSQLERFNYLQMLEAFYINAYTGTIISTD